MNSTTSQGIKTNPYECAFDELIRSGATAIAAAEITADRELDGLADCLDKKPALTAKKD